MKTFDLDHINKFILRKQHLSNDSKIDNITQIIEDIFGLHSTGLPTSYLSLLARTNNFEKTDLERELYTIKSLGRIRGMRRTLFIVTRNLIPIVHTATFKLIEKFFQKFLEVRGVSLKEYQVISSQILEILKGVELSASEIRKKLNSNLDIPAIIQVMCDYGLLLRGRPIKDWKDRRNRYALFSEYFPNIDLLEFTEEQAIQKLIKKYIKAYGPVNENDISWWSGLTVSTMRKVLNNIEPQIERIMISGLKGEFMIFEDDMEDLKNSENPQEPTISFLPELDPYPMGYKNRDKYIDRNNYNNVFDKSGNISATILLNGMVIGVWDTENKKIPVIKIFLFQPLGGELRNQLYEKACDVGKFYFDKEVTIKKCKSMIPLTERTAGGFMSPLKNC
ncbi:MAG: winged helix DNA-binding domain-containing protein [Candidatus Thorarchaeota archaeon]